MQRFLRTYSTWHEATRLWILCGDNGRHFNHSDTPNTLSLGAGFGDDVAAEDLPAGVELTTNYALICDSVRINGAGYLSAAEVARRLREEAEPRHRRIVAGDQPVADVEPVAQVRGRRPGPRARRRRACAAAIVGPVPVTTIVQP